MDSLPSNWLSVLEINPKIFVCGYCGSTTGVNVGYTTSSRRDCIYICGGCNRPTFFEYYTNSQTPAPIIGNPIDHLPADMNQLYEQARRCMQVYGYTAAVLLCRKLLMHIAVGKGADPNLKFIQYVDYLADKGYIPPDGRGWVDRIRTKGNEATHEIVIMSPEDATDLLSFTEMLLKFVYEFPARISPPKSGH